MAAGGWNWDVAAVIAVMGWLVSPIISLLLPKIFSCLGFDASQKLRELEIHIIPELQQTMHAVDQERMMQREKKLKRDVAALDKMAAMLRHALEDAEDIFDDAQHKIVLRCWHRLRRAFTACRSSSCVWIARVVQTKSAWILQWVRKIISWSRWLLRRPEDALPVITSDTSSGWWLSCLCSSFDLLKNCCASLYSCLAHVFEAACFYRDWSYQVVGIKKGQLPVVKKSEPSVIHATPTTTPTPSRPTRQDGEGGRGHRKGHAICGPCTDEDTGSAAAHTHTHHHHHAWRT